MDLNNENLPNEAQLLLNDWKNGQHEFEIINSQEKAKKLADEGRWVLIQGNSYINPDYIGILMGSIILGVFMTIMFLPYGIVESIPVILTIWGCLGVFMLISKWEIKRAKTKGKSYLIFSSNELIYCYPNKIFLKLPWDAIMQFDVRYIKYHEMVTTTKKEIIRESYSYDSQLRYGTAVIMITKSEEEHVFELSDFSEAQFPTFRSFFKLFYEYWKNKSSQKLKT